MAGALRHDDGASIGVKAMRISLCNEVIRELQFERQCAFVRAVGYDGVWIAPFTPWGATSAHPPRRALSRRATAEAEIAIAGFRHLMLAPWGCRSPPPMLFSGRLRSTSARALRWPPISAHVRSYVARRLSAGSIPAGRWRPQVGCGVLRRHGGCSTQGRCHVLHRTAAPPDNQFQWRKPPASWKLAELYRVWMP
jgi:hypothetical protein